MPRRLWRRLFTHRILLHWSTMCAMRFRVPARRPHGSPESWPARGTDRTRPAIRLAACWQVCLTWSGPRRASPMRTSLTSCRTGVRSLLPHSAALDCCTQPRRMLHPRYSPRLVYGTGLAPSTRATRSNRTLLTPVALAAMPLRLVHRSPPSWCPTVRVPAAYSNSRPREGST